MHLSEWQAGGEYLSWQGHSIFVRDSAKTDPQSAGLPVLLMIHGFPTASYDFHLVWPQLSKTHRLITFDMLGYGYSSKPNLPKYSIFAQADICEALLASKGVAQCEVLAHDVGDTVAQELLARFNQGELGFGLKKVTLLNGGLFPETHRAILVQKLLLGPFGFVITRLFKKPKFEESLRKVCSPRLPQADIDASWLLLQHNRGHRKMHILIQYMAERRANRDRWVAALQQAKAPLVLIDGVEDPISGGHMVDRFEELVPGHRVVRLPGLGHYPHLEDPQAVLAAMQGGGAGV